VEFLGFHFTRNGLHHKIATIQNLGKFIVTIPVRNHIRRRFFKAAKDIFKCDTMVIDITNSLH